MQPVRRAFDLAEANAGSRTATRIAMMVMTTRISIKVKASLNFDELQELNEGDRFNRFRARTGLSALRLVCDGNHRIILTGQRLLINATFLTNLRSKKQCASERTEYALDCLAFVGLAI
jgi:hypothetical protein